MLGVRHYHGVQIDLFQGDLTAFACDGMLSAADSQLSGGSGVAAAIHRGAGLPLQDACRRFGGCQPGSAVATVAGDLPAQAVVHAVGPVWQGGSKGEAETLAAAYKAGLDLCDNMGLRHVACAAISTGACGYPVPDAAAVALAAVKAFSGQERRATARITFVLYGPESYLTFRKALAETFPED